MNDESDYLRRAMAAYFRTSGGDQPDQGRSGVETIEDRKYVVLRNVNGILAVYRIRRSGALKRLRRWPAEMGGEK